MIRHVVLWELHDPGQARRFAELLRSCAGIVPGMLSFEVAMRDPALKASADVCLIASFADAEALQTYEGHALHRAVSAQLGPLRKSRHVIDFTLDEACVTAQPVRPAASAVPPCVASTASRAGAPASRGTGSS